MLSRWLLQSLASGVCETAFLEQSRSSALTFLAGLRHVSDDMKTHKNPALKNQGGPVRSGPKPFTAPKPACNANPSQKTSPKAPALLELEGKKWRVVSRWCQREGWRGGSFAAGKGRPLKTFLVRGTT